MRLRSGGVAGGLLEGRYDVSKALQRRCAGLDVVPKELQPWETAPPAPPQPKLCALDADAATLDFVAGARSKAASPFKVSEQMRRCLPLKLYAGSVAEVDE